MSIDGQIEGDIRAERVQLPKKCKKLSFQYSTKSTIRKSTYFYNILGICIKR